MKIEAATERDLYSILDLQKRAFYDQGLIYNDLSLPALTQTIDDIKNEFRLKTFYKAVLDRKIIGSIRCIIEDATLHIEKLIVEPDMQNRGIGTEIMREIENRYSDRVRRYELFTGHKSARNLHMYGKLGYKEIRREPLTDTCDLIVMEKIVDDQCAA